MDTGNFSSNIDQCWRAQIKEVFGICAAGGTSHREVAVVSEYIEADYHGRFLIELLQNANDQAVDADRRDSTVTLVWTDSLFAVANEGAPFNEAGLKSITSLGLSQKDPTRLIGNKGIGFKSVYQVSRQPEIFSARAAGSTFKAADAWRFRMLLKPFDTSEGTRRLEEICRVELDSFPEQEARLQDRVQHDPLQALMDEVRQAAPFKFPLDVPLAAAEARFAELGDMPDAQTLVVLPLTASPKTTNLVSQALDAVMDSQGSAILFLNGITRLCILDRVRDQEVVIEKRVRRTPSTDQETAVFSEVTVAVTKRRAASVGSEWRVAEAVFGERESDGALLREAAKTLPGSAWKTVSSSPVAVAVPLAPPTLADGGWPLEGRLCIGLPTHDRTGTFAWVHAHFFGTISRKGIDLSEGTFNQLLFKEAVRLHARLLERLKTDDELRARRAVTLAYHPVAVGPLLGALHAGPPLAHEPIVLTESGESYRAPATVWVVEPTDYRTVRMILDAAGERSAPFTLPDLWLAEHAGELLESLAGHKASDWTQMLLERTSADCSALEAAAATFRSDGADGQTWETFLGWVKKMFHPAELRGQRILPTIGGGLAAAVETVFLPFADSVGNAAERRSTDVNLEGAEFVDMQTVPPEVLAQLRFLDPQAVKVRENDGRKLTPLSSWLSPETGERLVRRPSVDELINQAVGPALAALSHSEADLHNGLVLLELVANWLPRLTGTTAAKVNKSLLLVPVIKHPTDKTQLWAWRAAPEVYFGQGWLDRTQEDLIVEAYEQCPEALMISQQDFLKACLPGKEETDWVNALEKMGVSRYPKWIKRSPQWRRVTFKAWDNDHLHINESDCPIDVATPWWRPYLEAVRCRKVTVRSGQEYDFAEVLWIDGLESERSRSAVFRLMLLHHEYYEGFLRASLARDRHGGDATQPDAFWVHAIKQSGWSIIPSTYGLKAPGEVWLLEGGRGTQNLKRHETLSAVKPEHRRAAKLLGAVGVASLAEPSAERLIAELDRLARRCGTAEPPSRAQSLLAMAQDLYERLQRVYDPATGPFPNLADRWLPFEQAGRLVGQPAKSVRLAYVDDAPERAPFVRDFADALHWPIRLADKALTAALRKQLVAEAVTFTSAAPAWTGFERNAGEEKPLLDWMRTAFPGRSVATDLGCLIAYTGREVTAPAGDQFARNWRAFEVCRLIIGRFSPGAAAECFLEASAKGERELQVAAHLENAEILAATWLFVGSSYRDTWAAYVSDLRKGRADLFLQERNILAAQREEVEAAIKVSLSGRLERFKPAFFALRKKLTGNAESTDAFAAGWEPNARTAEALHRWLGAELPPALLAELVHAEEQEGTLQVLTAVCLDVAHWQAARGELGLAPFLFLNAAHLWLDIREQLGALTKAVALRSPQSELNEVKVLLESIATVGVPSDLEQKPPEFTETLGRVLAFFHEEAAKLKTPEFRALLERRLGQVAGLEASTVRELRLTDPPEREVQEYRAASAEERAQTASERLGALLEVSQAVAAHLDETLDDGALRADPRLQVTISGYWANRFCLLAAFQATLQKIAPRTQERLGKAGIFYESRSRNEMYACLPELAQSGPAKTPRPERHMRLLGVDFTEAGVRADLAQASSVLGQKIKDLAAVDPFRFIADGAERARAILPLSGRKAGRRGGTRGGTTAEREQDKALHGRLGEIYVYELLRARGVSGFDDAAWQSENRAEYLGEGTGNNGLGYDFSFRDEAGSMTGRPGAFCLLEVKSSTGDANGSFPMSENEWGRATTAHHHAEEQYLILRVAKVNEAPALVDVLIDPYKLRLENKLQLVTADLWVYPGQPEAASS